MAASVAIAEETSEGSMTLAGADEPAAARRAIMVVGITSKAEALTAKNVHIAVVARSFCGLCACMMRMAVNPKGVAALSSPLSCGGRWALKYKTPSKYLWIKKPYCSANTCPPAFFATTAGACTNTVVKAFAQAALQSLKNWASKRVSGRAQHRGTTNKKRQCRFFCAFVV